MMPTRRSTSPEMYEVIQQALHEGRDVELQESDGFPAVVIDGVEIAAFIWESFGGPVDLYEPPSRDAAALIDELLDAKRSRRLQRRAQKLSRDEHLASEGMEI